MSCEHAFCAKYPRLANTRHELEADNLHDLAASRAEAERLKGELAQCELEFEAAVKNLNGVVGERDRSQTAERKARELLGRAERTLTGVAEWAAEHMVPAGEIIRLGLDIRAFLAHAPGTPEPDPYAWLRGSPGTPGPATARKHGSQLVPEEDRHDEDKKTAAHAAMSTPVAKAAWKALLVVAAEHGLECCEAEECYFPRCLGDGCEGEPVEPATTPDTGEGTR